MAQWYTTKMDENFGAKMKTEASESSLVASESEDVSARQVEGSEAVSARKVEGSKAVTAWKAEGSEDISARKVVCQICGASFRFHSKLNRHAKDIHGLTKLFSCRKCPHSTVFQDVFRLLLLLLFLFRAG